MLDLEAFFIHYDWIRPWRDKLRKTFAMNPVCCRWRPPADAVVIHLRDFVANEPGWRPIAANPCLDSHTTYSGPNVRPSVRPSIRPSIRASVSLSVRLPMGVHARAHVHACGQAGGPAGGIVVWGLKGGWRAGVHEDMYRFWNTTTSLPCQYGLFANRALLLLSWSLT